MSKFREWIDKLTTKQATRLAALRAPIKDEDLEAQAAWLVYAFWQVFVHHAVTSGALVGADGAPKEQDVHRLGSLCATLDLELGGVFRKHGVAFDDNEVKSAHVAAYVLSMQSASTAPENGGGWPVMFGTLTGEHTLVVPLVVGPDGNTNTANAVVCKRDITAQEMVHAVGPTLPAGGRLVALFELGRYMLATQDGAEESFGANLVTIAGDLASMSLPLNSRDSGELIERVEGCHWRLDQGKPGAKCQGLGPLEDCMLGYAQMCMKEEPPASDQGNQFDINTRGGIDPSLN
jgi:hypothetical protein